MKMNLVSLLTTSAKWIDSIQVYVMIMIINLIEPRIGKVILNHLTGNNCLEFCNGLTLNSYFFKLTLGSDCLELCF